MLARSPSVQYSARIVCGLALFAALACGLQGCAAQPANEAKAELEKLKKKEKPKPNFDNFKVYTEPNERSQIDPKLKDQPRIVRVIKPGHWTSMLVETKANNFDFAGELNTSILDVRGTPVRLDRNPFLLDTARSVTLPKGQAKSMEAIFFAPRSDHMSTFVANRLRSEHGSDESPLLQDPLPHLPSYQYFMVVLARDPARYTFLRTLDSVLPLADAMPVNPMDMAYYRIVSPVAHQPLALPSQSLCWTSMAWLLWDDMAPSTLTPEQQRALVEWLHWGGQIAVSGPAALDLLRGSFLDPYLPADAPEAAALDFAALAPLSERWTLSEPHQPGRPLRLASAWPGVKLELRGDGEFQEGTGNLVAERRVGRGRIVVTAFRLSERELWSWSSFDGFLNGAILRRPARKFDVTTGRFQWVNEAEALDPRIASNLRYFTRDALDEGQSLQPPPRQLTPEQIEMQKQIAAMRAGPGAAAAGVPPAIAPYVYDDVSHEVDQAKTQSGVAAWNDFSAPSNAARQTLREAAGISVPKREFVAWMLGAYLLVIVPLNWLVFRLLGRVEWAWIAVPVLSIGWGVAVVWLAQLDIGFARSETEVAVIEVQPDFSRGHLTRYTALYSSLSTSYNVLFDDPAALAQPFSPDVQILRDQTVDTVTLRTTSQRQLNAYPVSSNSTGMVHSEQMIDLGGALRWSPGPADTGKIENQTRLKLSGAVVVRRTRLSARHVVDEAAWLGDLLPGATAEVQFEKYDRKALADARSGDALTSGERVEKGLSLRRLIDCAQDINTLPYGDVRLVAWRDETPAGEQIEPAAAQARRAAVVVANLQFSAFTPPQPDESLRTHRPELDLIEPEMQPPLDAPPMIELINFGKKYGDFTAVDSLNLKIEAGELFGFIGPNGAGKSTTIRFLATLLKATQGEGIVNGHSVTKDPLAVRKSVGYMPDNFGVYDGMKVWEFLDFFAVAYQIPRSKRKAVIGDVLELLDLMHKRDDFVNGLSRGMKQRLCLAKTLVHDPPVLILDEPSSGLDPRARLEVKALLKELRRMGKTILISSHILTELADCCTSIGIIERGQMLMHGPIEDVYRRIRGNRMIEIKLVEGMDIALSVIRSCPQTRDVQIEDHQLNVELAADDEQVAVLLQQLTHSGARLRSFHEKDPTLEDVFMLVTKGLVI